MVPIRNGAERGGAISGLAVPYAPNYVWFDGDTMKLALFLILTIGVMVHLGCGPVHVICFLLLVAMAQSIGDWITEVARSLRR